MHTPTRWGIIDPSGHFSLSELNITQFITNTIGKVKDLRFVRWYFSKLGPKTYEILFGTENNGHDYIYAKHLSGGRSWKYEIFTRGSRVLGIPGLENGVFYVKPATDTSMRGRTFPIGLLSNKQFAIWNFLVIPFGFTEALGGGGKAWVPYNIPGVPGAFNCTKWAWEAAAAARVTALIPAG
jgi:hypothetical protein